MSGVVILMHDVMASAGMSHYLAIARDVEIKGATSVKRERLETRAVMGAVIHEALRLSRLASLDSAGFMMVANILP